MGSFVTCRRLLVSRRRAMLGLHIPVPGVGSKAVMPPDNTAQIFKKCSKRKPTPVIFPHRMRAQNKTGAGFPFPAGCKTLRRRYSCGATCFIRQEKTNKAARAERGDENADQH